MNTFKNSDKNTFFLLEKKVLKWCQVSSFQHIANSIIYMFAPKNTIVKEMQKPCKEVYFQCSLRKDRECVSNQNDMILNNTL